MGVKIGWIHSHLQGLTSWQCDLLSEFLDHMLLALLHAMLYAMMRIYSRYRNITDPRFVQ